MAGVDYNYCQLISEVINNKYSDDLYEVCAAVTADRPQQDTTKECQNGTTVTLEYYLPFTVDIVASDGTITYAYTFWAGIDERSAGDCFYFGVDLDDTTTICSESEDCRPGEVIVDTAAAAMDTLINKMADNISDVNESAIIRDIATVIAGVALIVALVIFVVSFGTPVAGGAAVGIIGGIALSQIPDPPDLNPL